MLGMVPDKPMGSWEGCEGEERMEGGSWEGWDGELWWEGDLDREEWDGEDLTPGSWEGWEGDPLTGPS